MNGAGAARGILTVALLLAFGCFAASAVEPVPPDQLFPVPLALGKAEHVIMVTVDGLRPDLISAEASPNLMRAMREGAATLEARTVMPCVTLPSHASMLTGLDPLFHGIRWNSYKPDRGHIEVPTVFDVAHEAGLRTALFAGKKKFRHLVRPGVIDHVWIKARSDDRIMIEAVEHLALEEPGLMMVHLPGVDVAGHFFGWNTRRQEKALARADGAIGNLFDALERTGLRERAIVILTADHGGHSRGHGTPRREDLTIPWIVWGDGVEPRKLPPVSIKATAGAALRALGLEAAAEANGVPCRPTTD